MSLSRSIRRSLSRPIARALNVRRKDDGVIVVPDYWDLLTDLPPELNYDFSHAASVTSSGGVVDAIANRGSLGGSWTSVTTGRPTYDSTWKRAIFGSGHYLGSADIAGFNTSGSLSTFIVFERRVNTAGIEVIFAQYETTGNRRSFAISFNASGQLLVVTSTAGSADSTTLTVTNANIEIFDVNLLTWVHNSGANTQTLRLNGSDVYTVSGTAPALFNTTSAIGVNLINGGAAGNFQGSLFELVAYNSALSDANRDNVEGYLWTKWDTILDQYIEAA